MHKKYFGDSYDIVKQALIGWLHTFGEWSVHPMFTEHITPLEATAFSQFLNATLISAEILSAATDRTRYFACCDQTHNLFLDPDTGLCLTPRGSAVSSKHLSVTELIHIVLSRRDSLTLVFDQSYSRVKEMDQRDQVQEKLAHLASSGIHGFAYISHACFFVLATDDVLIARAREALLSNSRLPAERFVPIYRIDSLITLDSLHAPLNSTLPAGSLTAGIKEDNWQSGGGKTTQIGYVNRNNQRCGGSRGIKGTDHGQSAYKITCVDCNHVYGANGSGIAEKKCPQCQGGAVGIKY